MKRPLQVVELRQSRCSLRFGVGACPATGTPKCYNTWATCPTSATRAAYVNTGRMRWRFVANRPGMYDFGDFSAADDQATNGIPVTGMSVSVVKSEINVGGMLDGKAPFGISGTCSISMDDFLWYDTWGDHYGADRVDMPPRKFWACFLARNALLSKMEIVIYDGYEGDDLGDMRQRLYFLDSIDGPENDRVTLKGISPPMLADSKRALFPPAHDIRLVADINDTQTSFDVLTGDEANISQIVGLTTKRFVLIGSEIIGYSGYTVVSSGRYTLTGCTRQAGGSTSFSASAGAKVGRVGHFEQRNMVDIAEYLLTDWTPIPAALIDSTGWADERDQYLSIAQSETFITQPTAVLTLIGELCQQGPFMVWWDEYAQLIKLQGIRPPDDTVATLDDASGILADTAVRTMEPDARLSRILVYHSPIDFTKTGADNFQNVLGVIEAEGELDEAGGEARTLQINARWVQSNNQAFQIISRIFLRYKNVPQMLSVQVDSKDRERSIADVLDITSRAVPDTEGKPVQKRWQVTAWSEVVPGQSYQLDLQDFALGGRFGRIMDVSATANYTSATDAEKARGLYIADVNGKMSDGSDGYKIA